MKRTFIGIGLAVGGAAVAALVSTGVAAAEPDAHGQSGPLVWDPTSGMWLPQMAGNYGLNNPMPFGFTPTEVPEVFSNTGLPMQNTVAGLQMFGFDSKDIAPFVQDYFAKYVTVDGDPMTFGANGTELSVDPQLVQIIDKLDYFQSEQQIIIPQGYFEDANGDDPTNIDWGVIDMHNFAHFLGGAWGYVYIDLRLDEAVDGSIGPNNDVIGTWFTTPFGAFDVSWLENGALFGSPYLQTNLFDVSDFNPGAFWEDTALLG